MTTREMATTAPASATEHVTPEVRATLRRHLEDELASITRRARSMMPVSDASDESERQALDLERDVAGLLDERALNAFDEIMDALRRLDAGEFGVCVDCVMPIGEARLLAIPHARRCLGCQATAENQRN